ncbi:MAG: hypothetical protein VB876_00025 [Pirellulales bacterium]
MNLLIKSQSATPENAGVNAHYENCAAPGAANESQNNPIDADLRAIIEGWHALPAAVKASIVAMVKAANS